MQDIILASCSIDRRENSDILYWYNWASVFEKTFVAKFTSEDFTFMVE